ncbi:MAG: hypothetical protein ACTSRS_07000 [Candidatus Helarchaeota archaeon]
MDLQDFVLGLYFVEVTISFELFLFFIFGWRREERLKKLDITSILAVYFLCLGIGRIILIIHDFHLPDIYAPGDSMFTIFWLAGTGISLLGMVAFIYLAEIIIPKNTHYLFTILSCATLVSIFFVPLKTAKDILYAMIPLIFLIGFAFLGYLIRKTYGKVRRNFVFIFIGQLIFGVGQGMNTDWIREWFINEQSFNILPIGQLLIISGLGLIALAFWGLPSLSEIEWHSKIFNLYIITREHGICCLYYPFQEEKAGQMAPQLVSGGVTGILSLVKEMTSSKQNLKEIDHEDIKILFEYGQYITAALLAEEDLNIVRFKLRQFVDEFEKRFQQKFIEWTGSIDEFEPAVELVVQIFEQRKILNRSRKR